MSKHGHVLWNELNTHKPDQAAAFFEATLGATIKSVEPQPGKPPYRMLMQGETAVAGIFALDGPDFENVPDSWLTYFSVDDADAAADKATASGGTILRGPVDIPNWGRMVVLLDAGGGVCAFIQQGQE